MCDMLGVSSSRPTDLAFSMAGFGPTRGRDNPSGWGLACYPRVNGVDAGRAALVVKEPTKMAGSELARYLNSPRGRPTISQSMVFMLHARIPTGTPAIQANTHPFERELWGRSFVLAHNGYARTRPVAARQRFQSVGSTDSETMFCQILDWLVEKVPAAAQEWNQMPAQQRATKLHEAVLAVAPIVSGLISNVNLLITDGDVLLFHCRYEGKSSFYLERRPGARAPPRYEDHEVSAELRFEKEHDEKAAIVVTGDAPTQEGWQPIPQQQSIAFSEGQVCFRSWQASPAQTGQTLPRLERGRIVLANRGSSRRVKVFVAPREAQDRYGSRGRALIMMEHHLLNTMEQPIKPRESLVVVPSDIDLLQPYAQRYPARWRQVDGHEAILCNAAARRQLGVDDGQTVDIVF